MRHKVFLKNPFNLLFAMGLLMCSILPLTVHAAGVVTDCSTFGSTGTPGVYVPGTLGAALVGGGDIIFQCSGTINVPLMLITADTRIDATGRNVTLNGSNAQPYMFAITSGVPRSELELKNLTITQGGPIITNLGGKVTLTDCVITVNATSLWIIYNENTQGSVGRMSFINTTVSGNTSDIATILNYGEMILTNSVVSGNNNRVYNGGTIATLTLIDSTVSDNSSVGIYNSGGKLTLTRSTVSGNRVNTSSGNGGGIFNVGTMTLSNSIVSNNYTVGFGGGIDNGYGAESTITDSTVSNNTGGQGGGGISNYGGHLTLTSSTLSGNSARDGGGIHNFDSQLTITNSTLSGNTASNRGGGIYNYAPLTLTHATLSDNSAPEGGGIYVFSSVTAYLSNTLIANSPAGGNCAGFAQYLTDNGYNLADDNACNLTASTSMPNTNPNLGPLADNGGLTKTHALLSGSPAVDRIPQGTNGCGTTITTDQRGVSRPQGIGCDIGAYEVGFLGDINNDGIIDISDVILELRMALALDPVKPCSDINGDAAVDISDVILTLRMALGLDQTGQCGG
jgi:Right handed beta helix region